MDSKTLKKKIMKFRQKALEKLIKAYEIADSEKEIKICSRKGEHFIIINETECWKEVLEFKGNTFEYNLIPYQEFFDAPKVEVISHE